MLTVARPATDPPGDEAGEPSCEPGAPGRRLRAALLADVVAFLSGAQREHLEPTVAQHALTELCALHEVPLELVWERESYTGAYHYDVLARAGDETISISCCVDDGF